MKSLRAALLIGTLFTSLIPASHSMLMTPAYAQEQSLPDIISKVMDSVVVVTLNETVPITSGKTQDMVGTGTGFIIGSDGIIVTNYHVVNAEGKITSLTVTLTNGKKFPVKVIIGKDKRFDLAVLKIDTKFDLPTVQFGDSDKVRVGQDVFAIGNPFNLDFTVTKGIISAKHRETNGPYDDFLQTDASINPGNSGGPLFDMEGKVIGIDSAIISPSKASDGLGLAIPSNLASKAIDKLVQYGFIDRGMIGIQTKESDDGRGVFVVVVNKGGPADEAGLKVGDEIIKFGDVMVNTGHDIVNVVGDTTPGTMVDIVILRNGNELHVSIVVGRLKQED